jgi:hypothetical protein
MGNDNFLPEGYEVPKGGDAGQFFKVEKDKTIRFRILGKSITGWEVFGEDKKPRRSREKFTEAELAEIKVKKDEKPKHFWAFPIYVYDAAEPFKAFVVTQKSIQNAIMEYYKDAEYGNPINYDLKITRKGEGLETVYTVIASPPKALDATILATFEGMDYDMNRLFEGSYPFAK